MNQYSSRIAIVLKILLITAGALLFILTVIVRISPQFKTKITSVFFPSHTPPLPHPPCRLGSVEVGVFSPEAGKKSGVEMSLFSLESQENFARYHQAIRDLYGVDMADFAYFSVDDNDGWQERVKALKCWLDNASVYGDPTLAIEPLGRKRYGLFHDSAEMRAIREVFREEQAKGVVVWARFASECNLKNSPYSIANDEREIAQYRNAARWFHSYMPSNVHLVFCPLINTAYLRTPGQLNILRTAYEPGIYGRIGGTLYVTPICQPYPAFDWYYRFMEKLDPNTPFQICEFEGTVVYEPVSLQFLDCVKGGLWPKLQRINLFAGPINPLAESMYSNFAWVKHGDDVSFAKNILCNH